MISREPAIIRFTRLAKLNATPAIGKIVGSVSALPLLDVNRDEGYLNQGTGARQRHYRLLRDTREGMSHQQSWDETKRVPDVTDE